MKDGYLNWTLLLDFHYEDCFEIPILCNIKRTLVSQQEIQIFHVLSSLWKQLSKEILFIQWVLYIVKNHCGIRGAYGTINF